MLGDMSLDQHSAKRTHRQGTDSGQANKRLRVLGRLFLDHSLDDSHMNGESVTENER